MAYSPSHRPTLSTNNLIPPGSSTTPLTNRRRTTPSPVSRVPPPPAPLDIPSPVTPQRRVLHKRSKSPLRNGHSVESASASTGSEDGSPLPSAFEEDHWGNSPGASSPNIGAAFARVASSVISSITKSPPKGLPTDAELEAQAHRERDISRRQAELILTKEAEERRQVEERVLALLEHTLPPPPSAVSPQPSPKLRGKDEPSWWSIAKSKLTPTKDPLTPAQQIIQDAKTREKEGKHSNRQREKEKARESARAKLSDPSLLSLARTSPQPGGPISPISLSRSQETISRESHEFQETPSREPSREMTRPLQPPPRPSPGMSPGAATGSPSREQPPIYAQFTPSGSLDIPSTLLTIARRFEKLEKWTVGHVRALEERMGDVEKWLVDKETRAEAEKSMIKPSNEESQAVQVIKGEINAMKGDVEELRSRVGQLGKMMVSTPARHRGLFSDDENEEHDLEKDARDRAERVTSMKANHGRNDAASSIITPPHSNSISSLVLDTTTSRTKLPYPTGDYTSPDPAFSPPHSPTSQPPGLNRAYHSNAQASIPPSGLPMSSTSIPSSQSGLPIPSVPPVRPTSTSPTPRKRYTVALSGPLASPLDQLASRFNPNGDIEHEHELHTAYFSTSPSPATKVKDTTIGGTPVVLSRLASPVTASPSPPSRTRAQSAYGFASVANSSSPTVTPLRLQRRTQSIDRFRAEAEAPTPKTPANPSLFSAGKFVDPLVIRKREKEGNSIARGTSAGPLGKGKIPFGQLVAFFDGEK